MSITTRAFEGHMFASSTGRKAAEAQEPVVSPPLARQLQRAGHCSLVAEPLLRTGLRPGQRRSVRQRSVLDRLREYTEVL